jgi:hypothetical protein
VSCPSFKVYADWARYQKNISILFFDINAEFCYATSSFIGVNSKPMVCRLEDGVIIPHSQTMIMFRADPLMRRVNEVIHYVVEAGVYCHWMAMLWKEQKTISLKIAFVHALDGYYSFNLYHMQTAFYLLLMGWCLSAACFMVEVLYNRVLKNDVKLIIGVLLINFEF